MDYPEYRAEIERRKAAVRAMDAAALSGWTAASTPLLHECYVHSVFSLIAAHPHFWGGSASSFETSAMAAETFPPALMRGATMIHVGPALCRLIDLTDPPDDDVLDTAAFVGGLSTDRMGSGIITFAEPVGTDLPPLPSGDRGFTAMAVSMLPGEDGGRVMSVWVQGQHVAETGVLLHVPVEDDDQIARDPDPTDPVQPFIDVMLTVAMMLGDPGVSISSPYRSRSSHPGARRAAKRAASDLRVIDLHPRLVGGMSGLPSGRHPRLHLVRGFYRNQPVGKRGAGLTKRIYISPFWRGTGAVLTGDKVYKAR